jgi:hypothetical protein
MANNPGARLKVLQLENWMKSNLSGMNYVEIKPPIHRNGWYLERMSKRCWFEVDGKAYQCPNQEQFEYVLSLLNHRPLTQRQVTAIKTLRNTGLNFRPLASLLHMDDEWKSIHLAGRMPVGMMNIMKILKRRRK